MNLFPKTVTSRDIQRNYRQIFDEAKQSKEPVVVLTKNTPDVAIIDVEVLSQLYTKAQTAEIVEAVDAIKTYKKEKQTGKLKKLTSLRDLIKSK